MEEAVRLMREGLDEMCVDMGATDAEWAKLNAIRFVENYRIMRSLEQSMEDNQ